MSLLDNVLDVASITIILSAVALIYKWKRDNQIDIENRFKEKADITWVESELKQRDIKIKNNTSLYLNAKSLIEEIKQINLEASNKQDRRLIKHQSEINTLHANALEESNSILERIHKEHIDTQEKMNENYKELNDKIDENYKELNNKIIKAS